MAIKIRKSMTNGQRGYSTPSFEELTKGAKAPKSLLSKNSHTGGRNAQGKITVRNIGGGNKIKYRTIDFKRNKYGIEAKVDSIQYDPNRTAYIALLVYADGEKRFILAPNGLKLEIRLCLEQVLKLKMVTTYHLMKFHLVQKYTISNLTLEKVDN